jgi:hypothetical protein
MAGSMFSFLQKNSNKLIIFKNKNKNKILVGGRN